MTGRVESTDAVGATLSRIVGALGLGAMLAACSSEPTESPHDRGKWRHNVGVNRHDER